MFDRAGHCGGAERIDVARNAREQYFRPSTRGEIQSGAGGCTVLLVPRNLRDKTHRRKVPRRATIARNFRQFANLPAALGLRKTGERYPGYGIRLPITRRYETNDLVRAALIRDTWAVSYFHWHVRRPKITTNGLANRMVPPSAEGPAGDASRRRRHVISDEANVPFRR